MGNNELVIKNEIHKGEIVHNYMELKDRVSLMVKPYLGLVFTSDTAKDGKTTVAKLRKFKTDLDRERKNLKRQWMLPYLEAEEMMKDVISVIDEPIKEINDQIVAFDETEKREKIEAIEEAKALVLGETDYADFIFSVNWFDDPRWINKSINIKKVKESIIEKIDKVESDIGLINQTCGEFSSTIITEYARSGDVSGAIKMKEHLIEEKTRSELIVQRQKEAEERRKAQSSLPSKKETQGNVIVGGFGEQRELVKEEPPKTPPVKKTLRFELTATKEGFKGLIRFCKDNDIFAIKIEEETNETK